MNNNIISHYFTIKIGLKKKVKQTHFYVPGYNYQFKYIYVLYFININFKK